MFLQKIENEHFNTTCKSDNFYSMEKAKFTNSISSQQIGLTMRLSYKTKYRFRPDLAVETKSGFVTVANRAVKPHDYNTLGLLRYDN